MYTVFFQYTFMYSIYHSLLIIQAIWQHKHKVFWFGLIIAEMKANTKEDNL